jgi:integrase
LAISRGLLRDKLPRLEAELRKNPQIGNRPIARKLGINIDTVRSVRRRMGIAPATWIGTPPITDFPRGIMLLFLTGCRSHEIGDLKWSEVDLDNGEIFIPGTRTKNHEHLCNPLSDWAVQILRRVKRRPGEDGVFEHPGLRKSNRAIKKQIAKAGISIPNWTPHDIRRTFRTRMAALGVSMEVGEALVNHTGHRTEVEGIYNRYKYWPEKRQALTMWEANLRAIIDGTAKKFERPRFGEPKKGGDAA